MVEKTNRPSTTDGLKPFYIAILGAVSVLVLSWGLMYIELEKDSGIHPLRVLFNLTADSLLAILPFALLFRYFRYSILIPLYINAIWIIGSLWNYRFWGDILGVSSLLLVGNINGLLLKSIPGLWNLFDLIYLLLPLVYTIIFIKWLLPGLKYFSLSFKQGTFLTVTTLVLFILGQLSHSQAILNYEKTSNEHTSLPSRNIFDITIARFTTPSSFHKQILTSNGVVVYLLSSIHETYTILKKNIDLSEDDKTKITGFIRETPNVSNCNINNKNKNVILIIVESLNSSVIGQKINGKEVTPVLNSLIGNEGTVSALHVVTQVRQGGSGDGQFIINTGLLPLDSSSTSVLFGTDNRFPSLTRIFNHSENAVVFADDGVAWNEVGTFKGYGFNKVYSQPLKTDINC